MKKALPLFMVLIASTLLFTSCKKDKDDLTVVGRWGLTYSNWKHTVNGQLANGDTKNYMPESEGHYTLSLTAEGRYSQISYHRALLNWGEYRIDRNKIYYKHASTGEESAYKFTITKDELSIKYYRSEIMSGSTHVWESIEKYKRL